MSQTLPHNNTLRPNDRDKAVFVDKNQVERRQPATEKNPWSGSGPNRLSKEHGTVAREEWPANVILATEMTICLVSLYIGIVSLMGRTSYHCNFRIATSYGMIAGFTNVVFAAASLTTAAKLQNFTVNIITVQTLFTCGITIFGIYAISEDVLKERHCSELIFYSILSYFIFCLILFLCTLSLLAAACCCGCPCGLDPFIWNIDLCDCAMDVGC